MNEGRRMIKERKLDEKKRRIIKRFGDTDNVCEIEIEKSQA